MAKQAFSQLRDVLGDVASRKQRAAKARTEGHRDDVESPREVYLSACRQVAAELVPYGYRFAKAGPHITLKSSPFTFTVSFHSSPHNVPGEHVALSLAAAVTSRPLKTWREAQRISYRKDDWVGGGLVHLLGTDLAFIQWDLADPGSRRDTIADVSAFITRVVVPYFQHFRTPTELITHLIQRPVPSLEIASAVECALCFGGRSDAQAILDRFARDRPDLVSAAERAVERFRQDGTPRHFTTIFAEQVALVVVAYGLEWRAA